MFERASAVQEKVAQAVVGFDIADVAWRISSTTGGHFASLVLLFSVVKIEFGFAARCMRSGA